MAFCFAGKLMIETKQNARLCLCVCVYVSVRARAFPKAALGTHFVYLPHIRIHDRRIISPLPCVYCIRNK